MALLKSVDDRPGVNLVEYRDQTYYGKYDYRCRITIEGLRRGHYFTPDEFEARLDSKSGYTLWGRIPADEKKIIKDNLPSIKAVLQFRVDNRKNKNMTIRCEYNTIAIFSNDLQLLHDSFDNIANAQIDYTQVETSGYAGVKNFVKEPKHKFRVYFKSRKVSEDFKGKLGDIFKANKQLRPSPGLKLWINPSSHRQSWYWWGNYLSSSYFIDYNDESYLSYLALLYGDLIGKKYKLQKRPDPV
jgi:hypothetical protein